MSCVEMENDEKRKHDLLAQEVLLRQQTKTFFGLEKPLLHTNVDVVTSLAELTTALHEIFSSDSVNIE